MSLKTFLRKMLFPLLLIGIAFTTKIILFRATLQENIIHIGENIISSIIIILIGYIVYLFISKISTKSIIKLSKESKTKVDGSVLSLINNSIRVIVISIIAVYILNLWGVQIGPLLTGLGIAGLAVALALQPTLSNIFSGISMILDRSLNIGDLVYLDESTKGHVEKIGFRSTKIRTFNNELLIVPNNKLAESQIQNVSLPEPKSRCVIPFSVAYGSSVEKVRKLVLKEIKKLKSYCKEPEPARVRFTEMANSSLNFKAYFYVNSFNERWVSIDKANTAIYNALNREGIEIPFPQLDVRLKK